MRVIPTGPTWLTREDFHALLKPTVHSAKELRLMLEQKLARYLGREHAVLTPSGTAGIYLVLRALDLSDHSEVLTPAYTCIRVPNAIVAAGLRPRFVDIDESANINLSATEAALTPNARCLLLTHLYGNPANMDSFLALAEQHNLVVIEDCCMTFDSSYRGQRCGTFGRAAVFSLNRCKPISAFGGGVVVTNDEALATSVRQLRDQETRPPNRSKVRQLWQAILSNNFMFHPWSFGNIGKRLGKIPVMQTILRRSQKPTTTNSISSIPLTDLATFQLRLGLCQLDHATELAKKRTSMANNYTTGLAGIRADFIQSTTDAAPSWSHYTLILKPDQSRSAISHKLTELGVQPSELFNYVCPMTPAYREFAQGDFPMAERFARQIINLPFYPYLSENDQAQVIAAVRQVLS